MQRMQEIIDADNFEELRKLLTDRDDDNPMKYVDEVSFQIAFINIDVLMKSIVFPICFIQSDWQRLSSSVCSIMWASLFGYHHFIVS